MKLLNENLPAEERDKLRSFGYFAVVGGVTGKTYRIRTAYRMNVEEISTQGTRTRLICFCPIDRVRLGDLMLAQKLALELYELDALAVASRTDRTSTSIRRSRFASFVGGAAFAWLTVHRRTQAEAFRSLLQTCAAPWRLGVPPPIFATKMPGSRELLHTPAEQRALVAGLTGSWYVVRPKVAGKPIVFAARKGGPKDHSRGNCSLS
jgi:hypothetical protein